MKTKRKGLTTVQIRPAVATMLLKFIKGGTSKSEVINEALRQYLIEKELESVKAQLLPYAQARGIYTHEDLEARLGS